MKALLVFLTTMALVLPSSAAFQEWSNKEGKTLSLSLIEVTGEGEEMAGTFIMKNGRKTTIKKSELSEESAKFLIALNPNKPSVFDAAFKGNLVVLDGDKLVEHKISSNPNKYFIFYYTASWCGPCKTFTPKLIEFYKEHKSENFEIIQISSDRTDKAMEEYAKKSKMPWPHLTFAQVKAFRTKFNHGVRGIPKVIVCDLEGNIVSSNGRNLEALEQLVK